MADHDYSETPVVESTDDERLVWCFEHRCWEPYEEAFPPKSSTSKAAVDVEVFAGAMFEAIEREFGLAGKGSPAETWAQIRASERGIYMRAASFLLLLYFPDRMSIRHG